MTKFPVHVHRRDFLAGMAAIAAHPSSAEPIRPKARPNLGGVVPKSGASDDPSDELQQLFGARIMVGFVGQDPIDDGVKIIAEQIAQGSVAGVILLQRNISSLEQLAGLTAFLRSARPDLPPLIAVDNEGGKVQRAGPKAGFLAWKSAAELGRGCQNRDCAADYYRQGAAQLRQSGVTLNFGPVVDLPLNPDNPVIAQLDRGYSTQPMTTTALAEGFIDAHRAAKVATCLKHFPGHGGSALDSHTDLPDISGHWTTDELLPFEALIAAGKADMVMMGHLLHPRFSDPGLPASLSKRGISALRDLGHQGPITTDDLQMDAVAAHLPEARATVLAATAGVDMLLFNTFKKPESQIGPRILGHLKQAYSDGGIDRVNAQASFERMSNLRKSLI